MRIYINTTPNKETVPFTYQSRLVGAFHKWLGENDLHDEISLYSLSWLSKGIARKNGLDFPDGSTFFISAPGTDLLKSIIDGLQKDTEIAFGMHVQEVRMRPVPSFGSYQRFMMQSPILIKRQVGEGDAKNIKFFYPKDEESDTLLTETLHSKLAKAGLENLELSVGFDRDYPNPQSKAATYKGITNKGTLCPVIVQGDPEAVAFAWEVGIGNSTGIGWGAVR